MQEVSVLLKRFVSFILMLALLVTVVPAIEHGQIVAYAEGVVEDEFYAAVEASDGVTVYQRGDRDMEDSSNIVIMQTKLIELGYLSDAADGVYGANTEIAMAAFQRNNGLPDTGIADAATQELLRSGTDLVKYSDSMEPGSVIYRVQEKFALWGFSKDLPDGKDGEKTEESVEAFQEYLEVYFPAHPTPSPLPTATPAPEGMGGFGDAEIVYDEILYEAEEGEIDDFVLMFVDGEREFDVYSKTVANGDTGADVRRVQTRLHRLNYLYQVDGTFGETTERALLYFQRKNGLEQTAVADEATQRLLFSEDAVPSEEFVNLYKIVIDISDQRVRVYQWNGSTYGICIGEMICSTGTKKDPTPLGTFQAWGPTGTGLWYYFKTYDCYAKWATRIVGGILFHSVTYTKSKKLQTSTVKKLGTRASHGCIRLEIENAKWMYENCTPGTTVVIQE